MGNSPLGMTVKGGLVVGKLLADTLDGHEADDEAKDDRNPKGDGAGDEGNDDADDDHTGDDTRDPAGIRTRHAGTPLLTRVSGDGRPDGY